MGRRAYVGNAGATTLASDITSGSTSIALADATNWPSPTGGTTAVAIIGRNSSSEEKITFSGRSGNTLTGCVRGFDSTPPASHTAGQSVEHGLSATDMDEVNDHVFDTTNDDHTQYLNTTRHDVTARHAFGAALGTPPAASGVVFSPAGTTGSSGIPARADHGHPFNAPACRVYSTGTQSLTHDTSASVAFANERFDTDTMHDNVTNNSRITLTTAGVYIVTACVRFAARSDYSRLTIGLRVNGTTSIGTTNDQSPTNTARDLSVTTIYKFAAADYVEVRVTQENGAAAAANIETVANQTNEFSAVWVGLG
jgi:hypothetical protein